MSSRLVLAAALSLAAAPLAAQTSDAAPAAAAAPNASASPARRAFAHRRHIRTEYHAPSGWTVVELMPMALDEAARVELRTSFRFPGHAPANAPASLTFAIIGRGASDPFAAKPALALVLDGGTPLAVAVQRFARDVSPGKVESVLYATMPRATFLRLTSATRAEVRVGETSYALAPDMLESLRDLASRLSPAGFRTAKSTEGTVAAAPAEPDDARALRADEVDTPIRPRGLLSRPKFPAGEPAAARRVWFRYVVDTMGTVETATLRGETPVRDSLFVESIRTAAAKWTFAPARKGGRPVRMEVRQVLEFDPKLP